jgi:hypothetical protein
MREVLVDSDLCQERLDLYLVFLSIRQIVNLDGVLLTGDCVYREFTDGLPSFAQSCFNREVIDMGFFHCK